MQVGDLWNTFKPVFVLPLIIIIDKVICVCTWLYHRLKPGLHLSMSRFLTCAIMFKMKLWKYAHILCLMVQNFEAIQVTSWPPKLCINLVLAVFCVEEIKISSKSKSRHICYLWTVLINNTHSSVSSWMHMNRQDDDLDYSLVVLKILLKLL